MAQHATTTPQIEGYRPFRQVSKMAEAGTESDLELAGSCGVSSPLSHMLSPSCSSLAVPDCAADASASCCAEAGGCRVKAGLRGVPPGAGCRLAAACVALLGGVLKAPARLRRKRSYMAVSAIDWPSLAAGCACGLPGRRGQSLP